MGAVVDRLVITFPYLKNYLRVDDEVATTVSADVLAGDTIIPVDNASFIPLITTFDPLVASVVSVNGVELNLSAIDSILNNIVSSVPLPANIPNGTPILQHPDDQFLIDAIQGAKEDADELFNNPFVDDTGTDLAIPFAIKIWICRHIGRWWRRREEGLTEEVTFNLGTAIYGMEEEEQFVYRYRLNPGL